MQQMLNGSSFVLPLNTSAAAEGIEPGSGLSSAAVWGSGSYRRLGGESETSGPGDLDWDGDLVSAHLGLDARLSQQLLAGIAVSWSDGSFDYDNAGNSGEYDSDMLSVHPYIGWLLPGGVNLWATIGYGEGEIEISDLIGNQQGNQQTLDTELKTAAVGASGGLFSRENWLHSNGTLSVRLKGEASVSQIDVDGADGAADADADLSVETQRFRLAVVAAHEQVLENGIILSPSLELGIRHDEGDGETGSGIELGGAYRYVNPSRGITLEGRVRGLISHTADYEEWGVSGIIRYAPGLAGRGLSFSLIPAWGQTIGGVNRLWEQDISALGASSTSNGSSNGSRSAPDRQTRMSAELAYGMPAFSGRGLLTPYGGMTLAGDSRRYSIGSRLELGELFDLSLEGSREKRTDGEIENGVLLIGRLRF